MKKINKKIQQEVLLLINHKKNVYNAIVFLQLKQHNILNLVITVVSMAINCEENMDF